MQGILKPSLSNGRNNHECDLEVGNTRISLLDSVIANFASIMSKELFIIKQSGAEMSQAFKDSVQHFSFSHIPWQLQILAVHGDDLAMKEIEERVRAYCEIYLSF